MELRPIADDRIRDAINSTKTPGAAAKKLGGGWRAADIRRYMQQLAGTVPTQDEIEAKNVRAARTAQVENNRLRASNRELIDALGTKDAFFDAAEEIIEKLPSREPIDFRDYLGAQAGVSMTVEALLSDLQIGKLAPNYNSQVARRRLQEYTKALLFQIEQKKAVGYRIEEIVLALLGDIIESDKKHKNSGRATDTGTAEQIYDAMESLFVYVIEPLARLGIKLRVVCITGNHDWDDHGLAMFRPGREQLSYPLYRFLEMLAQRSGYRNTSFVIPDGSYAVESIYGQHILYEHGVGVANAEQAMKAHKIRRSDQEKKYIQYFRMGDKHTVTSFNSGQLVTNGAFFGADAGGTEYSGIAGYASVAAQWVGFHVPRDDMRLTLYDTFTIQLGHIQ